MPKPTSKRPNVRSFWPLNTSPDLGLNESFSLPISTKKSPVFQEHSANKKGVGHSRSDRNKTIKRIRFRYSAPLHYNNSPRALRWPRDTSRTVPFQILLPRATLDPHRTTIIAHGTTKSLGLSSFRTLVVCLNVAQFWSPFDASSRPADSYFTNRTEHPSRSEFHLGCQPFVEPIDRQARTPANHNSIDSAPHHQLSQHRSQPLPKQSPPPDVQVQRALHRNHARRHRPGLPRPTPRLCLHRRYAKRSAFQASTTFLHAASKSFAPSYP